MGVLMLLLGIALPSLTRSREAARQSVCAQQIAQHMKITLVYAADNKDAWPFAWPKERTAPRLPNLPAGPPGAPDWYGAVAGLWQVPMVDAYGGDFFHRSLLCPSRRNETLAWRDHYIQTSGADPDKVKGTLDYQMSMAMYLDIRALNPAAPSYEPKYYIGQRVSSVMFPSKKAALFEVLPAHDPTFARSRTLLFPNSRNIASADGAVSWRSTAAMIPAVVPPQLLLRPEMEALAKEAYKGSLTPRGVAGFDW